MFSMQRVTGCWWWEGEQRRWHCSVFRPRIAVRPPPHCSCRHRVCAAGNLDSLYGLDDSDPLSFVVREIPPSIRPYIGNKAKLADAQKLVSRFWAKSQSAEAERTDKVS